MKLSHLSLCAASVFALASFTAPAWAQTAPAQDTMSQDSAAQETPSQIIRAYEPTAYWVEVEQLRIRDNPVAGDVAGMLAMGQKVQAYDQFENWVMISKPGETERWLNTDFLSEDHVARARYDNNASRRHVGFNRSNMVKDVSLDRIRIPEEKSARLYAASVKEMSNGNRIIVTRQNFRNGPHFEKRLVACGETGPTHVQLLGEGYSYMMMERDIRGQRINPAKDMPRSDLSEGGFSSAVMAIVKYSCEVDV